MSSPSRIVLLFLACRTSAWTPQGAVLDVPQDIDLEERIKADPNNCNVYYYLKTPLTCGEGNAFNKGTLRCDSLENVAKSDPACGEGGGGGAGGGAGFGGGEDSGNGGGNFDGNGGSLQGGGSSSSENGGRGSSAGSGILEFGEGSQPQYAGDSSGSNVEYSQGGGSQPGSTDVSGINGYPSQGRNEDFESSPSQYSGDVRKRSAEESSLPGYSSSSTSSVKGESGGESEEYKCGSNQSSNTQLGSDDSQTQAEYNGANSDYNGANAGYDGANSDYDGNTGNTNSDDSNVDESDTNASLSGYEDGESGAEDDTKSDSYNESDGKSGGPETGDELGEYKKTKEKGAGNDGGEGLSGYGEETGTGTSEDGEGLSGYGEETDNSSPRGGRESNSVKREPKEIGQGQAGQVGKTGNAGTGETLESNAWENRRVEKGWAVFKGLVGNPAD